MARPPPDDVHSSWLGPEVQSSNLIRLEDEHRAFLRLWQGFMTARIMLALALLVLLAGAFSLGMPVDTWMIGLCLAYLAETVAMRLVTGRQGARRGAAFPWLGTLAVDLALIALLQLQPLGNVSFTPLFALPALMAAMLGNRRLTLATAGTALVLLLADAWRTATGAPQEQTSHVAQAALTGGGLLLIAFLTNQLATRLAREEEAARRNRQAAQLQRQVNALVIEGLADGVMVIGRDRQVSAANPAARELIGHAPAASGARFSLDDEPAWHPLATLADMTFAQGQAQHADLELLRPDGSRSLLQAHTQLVAVRTGSGSPCVMFLQDRRELEARIRTEKLAAMGRMSAAVAHEIRNPLAAITQANALLEEELRDDTQRRLSRMVGQNAQRLSQIVDEVLDVARVEHLGHGTGTTALELDVAVHQVCEDWLLQSGASQPVVVTLQAAGKWVVMAPDHLRRVLFNLLDNARRHAALRETVRVATSVHARGGLRLVVWSDGPPLEPGVQRHLFEPFFSSLSRSSGLGLYICRELCERHGAQIVHERLTLSLEAGPVDGNAFILTLRETRSPETSPP